MTAFYTSVERKGSNILYRGWSNGHRINRKEKFKPELFVPTPQDEETDWKSLDGVAVEPMAFGSMYEASEFIKQYEDVEGFKIYGNNNYVDQFITKLFPNKIEYDSAWLNTWSIDIEVASPDGFPEPDEAAYPIISIAAKLSKKRRFIVWGLKHFDPIQSDYSVEYRRFSSEEELLRDFLMEWILDHPDIITGWYVKGFDIPYLVNRIVLLLGEDIAKKLSPWGAISQKEAFDRHRKITYYEISGVQILDWMDLFKKFTVNTYGPQEAYTLNHIAFVVLGERKLSYSEYSGLNELYEKDHQKFIEYNIRDVDLVCRMEDKVGLIELACTLAYKAGVNYEESMGTVHIWDSLIYRDLYYKKIAIPMKEHKFKKDYPGGYVKEPIPNMYKWVVSFDLASLYPNIMVQYNMSPETIVNDDRCPEASVENCLNGFINPKPQYAMAATGTYFRKDQIGFIPSIVKSLYDERVIIKGKMIDAKKEKELSGASEEIDRNIAHFDNQQMSIKILLNSLYGAMANEWFRYFDIRLAEGITLSGRLSALHADRALNSFLQKTFKDDKDRVIAMDTDSVYLDLEDVAQVYLNKNPDASKNDVVDYLDKICEKAIQPIITKSYEELADQMGAYENRMEMDREAIADRGIWTAKKRYILNIYDNEGVRFKKPEIKIKGIQAIQSSTPEICRKKLKESFDILMNGSNEDLFEMIENFRENFYKDDIENISFPRGITSLSKFHDPVNVFTKGTPIHASGALMYNKILADKKLENRFQKIKNGEKIKFVHLMKPNPINHHVIAFPDVLPEEFGLNAFIDKDTQFFNSFLKPLKAVTDAIGWKVENTADITSFFN